jgi:hypothetical protein
MTDARSSAAIGAEFSRGGSNPRAIVRARVRDARSAKRAKRGGARVRASARGDARALSMGTRFDKGAFVPVRSDSAVTRENVA